MTKPGAIIHGKDDSSSHAVYSEEEHRASALGGSAKILRRLARSWSRRGHGAGLLRFNPASPSY